MTKADPRVATTIHINRSALDRATALLPYFSAQPLAAAAGGGVKRAAILRLAIDRGLALLEEEKAHDGSLD